MLMRTVLVVVLLISSVSAAHAQEPSGDLARELLESLVIGFPFGGGDTEIVLGRVSPDLESLAMPSVSRIIGGVSFDLMSINVIALAPGPETRFDDWVTALRANGWADPPARRRVGPTTVEPGTGGVLLCAADSTSLSIAPLPVLGPETRVGILHVIDTTMSGCVEASEEAAVIERPNRRSPIPDLTPPPGTRPMGTGTSASTRQWRTTINIRTDLGVEEIGDHYFAQLIGEGWELGPPSATRGVVVRSVAFETAQDESWHGFITVQIEPQGGQAVIEITVIDFR